MPHRCQGLVSDLLREALPLGSDMHAKAGPLGVNEPQEFVIKCSPSRKIIDDASRVPSNS